MLNDLYFEDKLEEEKQKQEKIKARENQLRVTLCRLKKQGLIEDNDHFWQITKSGKKKIFKPKLIRTHHDYPVVKKSDKKIIISFDIPEIRRRDRNWLRIELFHLGFKILQKSVWLGPSPLPKEFITDLKLIKLLPYLKFFEVKEKDIA